MAGAMVMAQEVQSTPVTRVPAGAASNAALTIQSATQSRMCDADAQQELPFPSDPLPEQLPMIFLDRGNLKGS